MRRKVLIIKTGYCEILENKLTKIVSLGDVFTTTVILHLFKQDDVFWLTDEKAAPLLKDNPYIKRVIEHDALNMFALCEQEFDIVINLEKAPGFCALANKISAWQKYGFRLDKNTGEAAAYDGATEALAAAYDSSYYDMKGKSVPEYLFEMLGHDYQGENYILGYKPKTHERDVIGFNSSVGSKWPIKGWPEPYWNKLEKLLGDGYEISKQQHLHNLEGYMDWVHSCRTIITSDSLGMHLAIAMGKKTIALFGPTRLSPVYSFTNLEKISAKAKDFPCLGCLEPDCAQPENYCMDAIEPERVVQCVEKFNPIMATEVA